MVRLKQESSANAPASAEAKCVFLRFPLLWLAQLLSYVAGLSALVTRLDCDCFASR